MKNSKTKLCNRNVKKPFRVDPLRLGMAVLLIFCAAGFGGEKDPNETIYTFHGMSDASAAVALDCKKFILADDENNVLRVYRIDKDLPIFSYDMTAPLAIASKHPEADIEGATKIGDRIYWITSHGRNRNGKMRPNRYRFFVTRIETKKHGGVKITPIGRPYRKLVHDLLKSKNMCGLGLKQATGFSAPALKGKNLAPLAPKRQGLNIEALCASADGKTLYIGFRNPRPRRAKGKPKRALIVALTNPAAVLENKQTPVFSEPILLNLNGLGIRAMEYSPVHKTYFIVAGAHDEQRQFALYRWSGKKGIDAVLVRPIAPSAKKFAPEALVPFPDSKNLWLLSDDGSLPVDVSGPAECMKGKLLPGGKCLNKHLIEPRRKSFRGIWLKP